MATVLVKYNQIVKYALNFVFISALLVGSISGLLVFNFFFSELAPFTLSFFMPIFFIVGVVVFVLVLLGSIAFCTVYERKAIAVLQNRRGPNRAGFFGLIQALGDGVKLMLKAQISKKQTSLYFFYFAPFSALCLSWFLGFYIMFSSFDDFSIYFFLIWSSLNAYSLPLAGFSTSHSKFALLGGVRSFSQLLSYELCLAVVLLIVVSYTQTPILGEIIQFQIEHKCLLRSLSPVFIVWFISICAETNRVPFDLPEAEAELVAGFATEYASFAFAAFFLAEYGSILVYSYMTSLLFCNIKLSVPCTVFFFFVFSWVRTTLPRYKVDQLLWIGWYVLLPVSLVLFIFYFSNANIIGLLLSDLFNLIGFFFSSVWFFLVGLVKPSSIFLFFLPFGQINNKYQVIQHQNHTYRVGTNRTTKLRWFKRKQDIFTHNTTVDLDRDDSPSFILPLLVGDKQVASSSWLLVPLVTALGSLYHLLAAANGVSYSFLIHPFEILGAFNFTALGSMLLLFCALVLLVVARCNRLLRAECGVFSFLLIILFSCTDYLVFFVAFEALLAPTLYLIYKNSNSPDFGRASLVLVLFSFLTMLFFLISTLFLYVYFHVVTFENINYIAKTQYDETIFPLFRYLFFFSFAFKMSLIPFHVWLPKAHVEGDLAMSWVLGGVVLKAAFYGLFMLCLVPFNNGFVSPLLIFVCLIGMLLPLALAVSESHMKRMIAYFSISHMSFAIFLLLNFQQTMLLEELYLTTCGLILGTMHTFISNLLFLLIDLFYKQTKTKYRIFFSAILEKPLVASLTMLLMLDNVGALPLTFNFCTEVSAFVILVNLNNWHMVFLVVAYLLMSGVVGFNQLLHFWRIFKYSFKHSNSVLDKKTTVAYEPEYRLVPYFLLAGILVFICYLLFIWYVGFFFQNILFNSLICYCV